MVQSREAAESPRPHDQYRREFMSRVLAFEPQSILDVGCGAGASLDAYRSIPVKNCVGIDPEQAAIDEALAKGLDVRLGRAEELPFPNLSFDVVTLEFAAHHVENLDRTLLEAIRIARKGVVVLDCWYDDALASQRVARKYDEWLKRIDRRAGLVHNACPSPDKLASLFLASGFSIDYACRLILTPIPVSKVELEARKRIEAASLAASLTEELEELLDLARLNGISDDGAILFSAVRP